LKKQLSQVDIKANYADPFDRSDPADAQHLDCPLAELADNVSLVLLTTKTIENWPCLFNRAIESSKIQLLGSPTLLTRGAGGLALESSSSLPFPSTT
jgi:hypothetical protein